MVLFVKGRDDGSVGTFVAGSFASAFCGDYHGRPWAPFFGSLIMLFSPRVGDLPLRVGIRKFLEDLVGLLLVALDILLSWRPFGLGYTTHVIFFFFFYSGVFKFFIKAAHLDLRSLVGLLFPYGAHCMKRL
jgi:hypothetical protein